MSALLPHNPIYVRQVRQQTRPGLVLAVLGGGAAGVAVAMAFATRIHDPQLDVAWEATALRYVMGWACLTAVNACAMLVGIAASEERLLGTLDIHRTGPVRPFALVVGLVAGAPFIVWVLLLALGPVCLSLALRAGLALDVLAGCVVSVATTSLLAALATLTLALGTARSSQAALCTAGCIIATGLLSLGYVGHLLHLPPLYYVSGMAPFSALAGSGADMAQEAEIFGLPFPPFLYQALCQGGLIAFFGVACVRLAHRGERLPWSKMQVLCLDAALLALFLGSMPGHPWLTGDQAPSLALVTAYFMLALGIVTAMLVTPRRVHHARSWRRLRMEEEPLYMAGFADGAASFAWHLVFCVMALGACMGSLLLQPQYGLGPTWCVFCMATFQAGWIAGGLETYILGRGHYRRGAFFVSAAFPWLIFPVVGLWMRLDGGYPMFAPMLISLSPVTGIWYAGKNASAAVGDWQSLETVRTVFMPLLFNGCFAAVTLLAAWATRQRMHQA